MTMFPDVRHLCVFWAFLVSCSDASNSTSVKSLEAFSGGFSSASLRCSAQQVNISNVEQHSYWTSFQGKILPAAEFTADRRESLKKSVIVALSAVPEPLVRLFMLNGDIRVTPDAGKICAVNNPQGHGQFQGAAGCFVAITENNRMSLSIVTDATPAAIGSTIVRSFGYWVSQHLSNLYGGEGALYKRPAPNRDFSKNQTSVARNYFSDVVEKRIFDLNHFEDLIGSGGAAGIKANIRAKEKDLLTGVTFNVSNEKKDERSQRKSRFESYIFAESFDSFYCNSFAAHPTGQKYSAKNLKEKLRSLNNTRLVFRDLFPDTFSSFEGIMGGVVEEVAAFLNDQVQAKKSSGLWLADDGIPVTPLITGNPVSPTPETTPAVNVKPDALTVIIDAQGQNINADNIQIIQPTGGLNQDLNIEIINQSTESLPAGSIVDVGGLQTEGQLLDTTIVTPSIITPSSLPGDLQNTAGNNGAEAAEVPSGSDTNSGVAKPQSTGKKLPAQTGQMSQVVYPRASSWSGYRGGRYGGYGGCH